MQWHLGFAPFRLQGVCNSRTSCEQAALRILIGYLSDSFGMTAPHDPGRPFFGRSIVFGEFDFYSSCRRPILSGLLCLFSFLGLMPICDEFRIWASNLVRFYFIEFLSRYCFSYLFRVYSSYLFVICVQMSFYVVSY